MRVCLGGTFGPFHDGHAALLRHAVSVAGQDGHVFVGLVTDDFATAKRTRAVPSYDERHRAVADWFTKHAPGLDIRINALADPMGPSATGDYDAIVVSPETRRTSVAINEARRAAGLRALTVHVAPYALAEDLLPINATRVEAGDLDIQGHRLTPVRVRVGSANPVKVEAVRIAFERFLPETRLDVQGVPVESGVDEQPLRRATWDGARRRAEEADRVARRNGESPDYTVGLEAGLFDHPSDDTLLLDVQCATVRDRTGWATQGHGPGFAYPPAVSDAVRTGQRTIEEVVGDMAGDPAIGRTRGAVGYLTDGRLDRTRLSESAVEAALVPRVRRHLYDAQAGAPSTDQP